MLRPPSGRCAATVSRIAMQLIPLLQVATAVVLSGAAFPTSAVRPDEGMWPFDGLPLQVLKEKYGFEPTKEWLDHVRLGSVRFDTGGSGSFVSPDGLVMTNHHVALETIQKVSTQEKDWVKDGFSSRLYGSELPGTDLTLRQLIEIKDVTGEILAAKAADQTPEGNDWREKFDAMCKELTDAEKHLVADPVRLYDDNQFRIYVYHVYDDVRVVFAPEKQVAFFGGDPDNFTYPRYDLDCAFFRVYEDGKPIDSSKFYFQWNEKGAATDELVFVSGHPGSTERSLTYEEMVFHRDVSVPAIVNALTSMRDQIKKQMERDEKQAFELRDRYFSIANSLKAYEGHLRGLRDADRMALSALAQCLKAAPDGEPWRGTELVVREPPEPFDAELASRRATNVVTFLRLSGVHGVDFEIRAVGETGAIAGMPVLYPASRAVAK